jgi:hypothetical protein
MRGAGAVIFVGSNVPVVVRPVVLAARRGPWMM